MEDVEIQRCKLKNEEWQNVCNQCRPTDGAYGY